MEYLFYIWEIVKPVLAALSLLIVPLSMLNLYFSLFPRLKDWNSNRSKNAFLVRLDKKVKYFEKIEIIRKRDTHYFILELVTEFTPVITRFLLSFLSFIFAVGFYFIFLAKNQNPIFFVEIWMYLSFITAYFNLQKALNKPISFANLCVDLYNPFGDAKSIINFINKGKQKGFITLEDNELATRIAHSDLFTDSGKDELRVLAGMKHNTLLEMEEAMSKLKATLEESKNSTEKIKFYFDSKQSLNFSVSARFSL
ncbi:MAG: hypothetical protein M3384_06370 [Acidobacteriota bacterium]|nr:hypothetical protein [Acidobacteriota bacterium]